MIDRDAHHATHCRAFTLVLVLVAVVIAALTLAGLARRTLLLEMSSREVHAELAHRTLATSIESALLPVAEDILAGQPDEEGHSGRFTLDIDDRRVRIVLADEQAKPHAGFIPDAAFAELDQSMPELRFRPRPSPAQRTDLSRNGARSSALERAYVSFEELVGPTPPEELWPAEDGSGLANALTLWGNGRVNIARADDDTVRVALASILSRIEIERLLRFREDNPDATHAELIGAAQAGARAEDAAAALGDGSRCMSCWIWVEHAAGSRVRLSVKERPEDNASPSPDPADPPDPRTPPTTWRYDWRTQ